LSGSNAIIIFFFCRCFYYAGVSYSLTHNGLALGEEADFRSTKLSAGTELDTKHKASFNH